MTRIQFPERPSPPPEPDREPTMAASKPHNITDALILAIGGFAVLLGLLFLWRPF